MKLTRIGLIRKVDNKTFLVPRHIVWDKKNKHEVSGLVVKDHEYGLLVDKLEKSGFSRQDAIMIATIGHNVVVDINWHLPPTLTEIDEKTAEAIGILI